LEDIAVWSEPEQIGVVEAIVAVAAGEAEQALVVVEADHGRSWGRGN
jgi:citrate lyase beta subunit